MLLLVAFLIVPLIEIALFIQIGGIVGLGWTLVVVVATAVAGAYLVRQQGVGVLKKLQASMHQFDDPAEPLAEGAMILFSGALLLTPGFFTDFVGFGLLVPGVRIALYHRLKRSFGQKMQGHVDINIQANDDIVEGEYKVDHSPEKPSGWTRH